MPSISVVVATRSGWPAYRPFFEHHLRETVAVGGELIVLDGSETPEPPQHVQRAPVVWRRHPGESVLALRARGYSLARADIVVQSEDHCRVPPGWAAAILRAHAENDDAAAIGGATHNGSTGSATEWAGYLVGQGRFAPPLGRGRRATVLGLANVSYKRWALASLRPIDGIGVNEAIHQRALAHAGETLLLDDRIQTDHVQPLSFIGASSLMFHAGRAMAATRRARMTPTEILRAAATPISPLLYTARLGVALFRRRAYRSQFMAAAPLVAWLYVCRGAGEVVGYARGAGDSALQLH